MMYILYDDRGVFEPEEAAVLTTYGDVLSREQAFSKAIADFQCGWSLYDDDNLIAWQAIEKKNFVRWAACPRCGHTKIAKGKPR